MSTLPKGVSLTFDSNNQLRIVDPDLYQSTVQLATDSKTFLNKTNTFHFSVSQLIDFIAAESKKIEAEKLKAIGARNIQESEEERRKHQLAELQSEIMVVSASIQRTLETRQSLMKVEMEQRAIIERLSQS